MQTSTLMSKPPCAAGGTHAGQPWQCTRDGKDKARHFGRLCPAHYMQWARAGYPDAFEFSPMRSWQRQVKSVVTAFYLPADMVQALRARAASEGRSVSSLGQLAVQRLLDDDS